MSTKNPGRRLLTVCLAIAGIQLSSAALAADPIRIGAIVSATGPATFLGDPEQKTLEMMVKDINAAGGVLGRQLELVLYDDGSDATKANAFARRLTMQDNVDVVIGPSTTGSTMAIVPQFEGRKTPLVSLAGASVIVEPAKPYVFKMPHSDRMAAQAVLDDLKKRGIKSFALLSDTGGFGKSGREETVKLAAKMGLTISADEAYGEKDTDMTPQLTHAKDSGAGAIFVFGTGQAPTVISRNYQQLKLTVPLYMSHGQASTEYIKLSGPAGEGVRMPTPALLVADQLPDSDPQKALSLQYKTEFEKLYKVDISSFGGYAYDGIRLIVDAIKRAGGTDKEKLRAALEATSKFAGASGIYSMSPTDHMGLGTDSFRMVEVKGGQFKLVP